MPRFNGKVDRCLAYLIISYRQAIENVEPVGIKRLYDDDDEYEPATTCNVNRSKNL